MLLFTILFAVSHTMSAANVDKTKTVDVCVYGGTASGVIAAYSAKMMGKTVLLVEPGKYLGGMTTGGLGSTDIGNNFAVTGWQSVLSSHRGTVQQIRTMGFSHRVWQQMSLTDMSRMRSSMCFINIELSAQKNGTTIISIRLESSTGAGTTSPLQLNHSSIAHTKAI